MKMQSVVHKCQFGYNIFYKIVNDQINFMTQLYKCDCMCQRIIKNQ